MKRFFDILSSLLALIILFPFLLIISIFILFSGKGGVFYLQTRLGKDGKQFKMIKFRTMVKDADKKGLLTVGVRDPRITRVGYFLRKTKLDEFPQLINVLTGDMSVVGPRPEVPKYVALYSAEQRKVLSVKPGLTDYASIEYINEDEVLGRYENPEQAYITEIMPAKLALNLKYIQEQSMGTDLKIILRTIGRIL